MLFHWLDLDLKPLTYAFHVAGITDVYHHTQLNDFSLTVLSPLLALNYHLPDLCLLSEYLGLQVCKELFIK
jgi:hypothetical protein